MPFAKVTGMTFTLSDQTSGWRHLEQKSQRENTQECTRCDQIQRRQSEGSSKSYSRKQMLKLGKSPEWLERTWRTTRKLSELGWGKWSGSKTVNNAQCQRASGVKLLWMRGLHWASRLKMNLGG